MLLLGICLAYTFSSNVYAVRKGDTYSFSNGAYLYADSFGVKPIYYLYIPKSVGKPEIIHNFEVYGTGNWGDFITGGWIARYFAVIPFGMSGIYDCHMVLYDNGAITDAGNYWRVRVRGMIYSTRGSGSTHFQSGYYVMRDYNGKTTPIAAGTTMTCSNKFEFWPLICGRQPGPITCYDGDCFDVGWTNNYGFDDDGGKELRFYVHDFTYTASFDDPSVWLIPFSTFPAQAVHKHSYTVTANATCTTKGSKKCACGDVQAIPATGHSWNGWQRVKDPTVYEPGSEVRTCKNNGSHKETKEIPKKNFMIYSGDAQVQKIYLGTTLIMNAASGNDGLVK